MALEDGPIGGAQARDGWGISVLGPCRLVAPPDGPDHLASREMMRWSHTTLDGVEPYSLQWFLDIENVRYARQGRWLPALLEFGKHQGEVLLGLGDGLGTDWAQYARQGAEVVACCPSQRHLDLVRRNFQLRGLSGTFRQADPCALPLESASIDVAHLSGLPALAEDAARVLEEVYRVLKPGGKVLALAPAAYDVDYWTRTLLGFARWFGLRGGPSGCWAPEGGPGYTARQLRRLFHRFHEPRHWKRHLRRADVPHLWRVVPLTVLQRLIGRLLVFKAFKPLSALRAAPLAA